MSWNAAVLFVAPFTIKETVKQHRRPVPMKDEAR